MKRYTVWFTNKNGRKSAWDIIAVSERSARYECYNLAGNDIEITYVEVVGIE